jgi:hypothetical protein
MSAALTLDLGLDDAVGAPRRAMWRPVPAPPAAAPRGRVTLDDVVGGAWAGLLGRRAAGCPVCGAQMEALEPSGSRTAGGHCGDCGTTLR